MDVLIVNHYVVTDFLELTCHVSRSTNAQVWLVTDSCSCSNPEPSFVDHHSYQYSWHQKVFIAFNINHSSILPLMSPNSLYCTDVLLSHYSLTHPIMETVSSKTSEIQLELFTQCKYQENLMWGPVPPPRQTWRWPWWGNFLLDIASISRSWRHPGNKSHSLWIQLCNV